MFVPSLEVALLTFNRMKAGERVVTNDQTLDVLSDHFKDQDTADASLFFRCCDSMPNPKRVGTLDQYVAWIDPN